MNKKKGNNWFLTYVRNIPLQIVKFKNNKTIDTFVKESQQSIVLARVQNYETQNDAETLDSQVNIFLSFENGQFT